MNYEQFVQEMYEGVRRRLCGNILLEKQKILKNNGITLTGFSIRKEEEVIAPVIYLEEYYERFLAKIKNGPATWKKEATQRKRYKIFKCPSCSQKLRIPRGHGRVEIRCKKCQTLFCGKT